MAFLSLNIMGFVMMYWPGLINYIFFINASVKFNSTLKQEISRLK